MNQHGVDPGPPLRHQPLHILAVAAPLLFSKSTQIVYQASHLNFHVGSRPALSTRVCVLAIRRRQFINSPFVADCYSVND